MRDYQDFGTWLTSGKESPVAYRARKAREKAEWEAIKRERERIKAQRKAEAEAKREQKQREWEASQRERARRQAEYEAKEAAKKRKWEQDKRDYEARKAARAARAAKEAERKRREKRGGTPLFGSDGRRIGTEPTKRVKRSLDHAYWQVLNEKNPGQKKELHHSHPEYLGGDKKQWLTLLNKNGHGRLHSDMHHFFKIRGVVALGKEPRDVLKEHGRSKLTEMTGDFYLYDGPNGGARYTDAAGDFFKKNPGIRDKCEKRILEMKDKLSERAPQQYREVARNFYEEKFRVK